jgi:hypothetical protein
MKVTFVARVAVYAKYRVYHTQGTVWAKADITVQGKPFTEPENIWCSSLTVVNLTVTHCH